MGKDILHRVGNGGHCGCETVSREVLPQVEIPEKWTQEPPCFAITIWCAIKIAHQSGVRGDWSHSPCPLRASGTQPALWSTTGCDMYSHFHRLWVASHPTATWEFLGLLSSCCHVMHVPVDNIQWLTIRRTDFLRPSRGKGYVTSLPDTWYFIVHPLPCPISTSNDCG